MSNDFPSDVRGGQFGGLGEAQPLGNLAQSARKRSFKWTRIFFLAIGLLNLAQSATKIGNIREEIHKELMAEVDKLGPGFRVDQGKLQSLEESLVPAATIVLYGMASVGATFIVLALLMGRYPLPTALLGLVLYIAISAFYFYQIFSAGKEAAWVTVAIRLVIVVGLIKAVQSAFAYQREKRAEPAFGAKVGFPEGAFE